MSITWFFLKDLWFGWMLWGWVGWFPVQWGGIRFGWRTSEMVRFILDISLHHYILSASIRIPRTFPCLDIYETPIGREKEKPWKKKNVKKVKKCLQIDFHQTSHWRGFAEAIHNNLSFHLRGVSLRPGDNKTPVMDRTGCSLFFLKQKVWSKVSLANFWFFSLRVDLVSKKEKASWQAGRSSWSFFGSLAARGSHFTSSDLVKLDILISSSWSFCDRQ